MNSLSLKILNRGFVSRYQQFPSQKAHFKYEIFGNVFEADGTLVSEGLRSSTGGDHVYHSLDEALTQGDRENAQFVDGRVLYAGHLMLHYGHFITEGLGRLYPLIKSIEFDHIAFLPFVFGGGSFIETPPDYHQLILSSLGISLDEVILVRKVTCFNELWVPSPAWPINSAAHPVMSCLYHHIREFASTSLIPSEWEPCPRLYISRSNNLRSENNNLIEEVFKECGFNVVSFENYPFQHQLKMLAQARFLAGFSGSGLHNIVFCSLNTSLIEITDTRSRGKSLPMQLAANAIDGRRCLVVDHDLDPKLIKNSILHFLGD